VGESRDSRNFWSTPYYLRNGWSYECQIWQIYSEGPWEQKPIKNLGENGAWAYTGTAQVFWVPPIISEMGKATNFNFCTHILSIDRNKSPLQISGKVAGCVVRTLKTFQGTYTLGASRGLLCDCSAVLLNMSTCLGLLLILGITCTCCESRSYSYSSMIAVVWNGRICMNEAWTSVAYIISIDHTTMLDRVVQNQSSDSRRERNFSIWTVAESRGVAENPQMSLYSIGIKIYSGIALFSLR